MFHVEHSGERRLSSKVSKKTRILAEFLGIWLILGTAAFCAYWAGLQGANLLKAASKSFYEEYRERSQLSFILESALTAPSKDNLLSIERLLLDKGEYKTAELLDHYIKNPNFYPTAAEAALFNLNYDRADRYLAKIEGKEERNELFSLRTALTGPIVETVSGPMTNAGKLLEMINTGNFHLYRIDNPLGEQISRINNLTKGMVENRLRQAQNLSENGYYYLALATLKADPGRCTRDYYILKADIYGNQESYDEALQATEQGLTCSPIDQTLISKGIEYSLLLGDSARAEFYRQRLNSVVKISK